MLDLFFLSFELEKEKLLNFKACLSSLFIEQFAEAFISIMSIYKKSNPLQILFLFQTSYGNYKLELNW